tara:strand:+ start:1020 stop:1205 length:186 start_codon:yes stop_codon:yes gene_type:complete
MKKIFLITFILISLYGCEKKYLLQGNNPLVPMPIFSTDCSNDNNICENENFNSNVTISSSF